MKNVHLLIADLFLPKDFVAAACAKLHLPYLEKILAQGGLSATINALPLSLEDALCDLFSIPYPASIAAISAKFDGLPAGCWMRADPVHVRLQREQVILLPNLQVSEDESVQLCDSLNEHFIAQGMRFFAPHPTRWYVQLDEAPQINTMPMSQVVGRNIQGNLPTGVAARHWHQLFNEIQMLLFSHPINASREAGGALPVNSVWFWGGLAPRNSTGENNPLPEDEKKRVSCATSDEVLVEMLAAAAAISFSTWSEQWHPVAEGRQLLVYTGLRAAIERGDWAGWRDALLAFEAGYAKPLWQALRTGKIAQLTFDVLSVDSLQQRRMTRADTWAFWRRSKRLADYSIV
ncbi:MAG: hypothetical protein R8K48_05875 [Gallionella sp.]